MCHACLIALPDTLAVVSTGPIAMPAPRPAYITKSNQSFSQSVMVDWVLMELDARVWRTGGVRL